MAHHALHVLGSRVFGFTQDPFNDTADVRPDAATAAAIAEALGAIYPNVGKLAAAATHDGGLGGATTTSSSDSGSTSSSTAWSTDREPGRSR